MASALFAGTSPPFSVQRPSISNQSPSLKTHQQHSGYGSSSPHLSKIRDGFVFFKTGSSASSQSLPTETKFSRISMRVSTKQAYICRDCGYIYNDRTPFQKLPDSYFCPVCGASKKRFRPYESPVARNANETSVRKARKEQIKQDDSIKNILPIAIVVGALFLVGTYLYLNSQY